MSQEYLDDPSVASHWDENAEQWHKDVNAGMDVYREFFTWPAFEAFIGDVSGKRILDMGCGEGNNTRKLAKAGAHMFGIDVSANMLAFAKKEEEQTPLAITYKHSSFSEDSGFPPASFHMIVSTLALMDGPDFEGAMREAYRLLKPGGTLAFSVLHPCFITPGLSWRKNEAGETTGLIVSRYFDSTHFTEHWKFSKRAEQEDIKHFSVPRFPRTISAYINPIIQAGLQITQIEEPLPSEEAIRRKPRFHRWKDHCAFLLMVKAIKPA